MKARVLEHIKAIEKSLDAIKKEIHAPNGIRIIVINREGFKLVEFWDPRNKDYVTLFESYNPEIDKTFTKAEVIEGMDHYLIRAIEMIPISDIDNTFVEIYSDLEFKDLSCENKVCIDNLMIDYNTISDEMINEVKERYKNVNDNLQRL